MQEPTTKRAIVFVDGQNLFHAAKDSFGYRYPNYDVVRLGGIVCAQHGWECGRVNFYTGIPEASDNFFWHHFWTSKLSVMGSRGVRVFCRALRYRNQTINLADGTDHTVLVGQEKGIDIRIALDIVHAARAKECDVALVFSQDQDLSEVADEVRLIAAEQARWFKMASAYPCSPTTHNKRGVNKTDWIRIDRTVYDQCLDPADYRPKQK